MCGNGPRSRFGVQPTRNFRSMVSIDIPYNWCTPYQSWRISRVSPQAAGCPLDHRPAVCLIRLEVQSSGRITPTWTFNLFLKDLKYIRSKTNGRTIVNDPFIWWTWGSNIHYCICIRLLHFTSTCTYGYNVYFFLYHWIGLPIFSGRNHGSGGFYLKPIQDVPLGSAAAAIPAASRGQRCPTSPGVFQAEWPFFSEAFRILMPLN